MNKVLQRDSLINFLDKSSNEKIKFISPDFGAKPLDDLRLNKPESFIYPGIAEQVSVDIAYGVALGKYLPILYGMSPFISARCYEQYKVLFGQTRLPLCIMPVGVGLGYDHNTLSHYSLDDIGLYSSIPGLQIYTPYDSKTAITYLQNWLNSTSQIVLRLERQAMPFDIFDIDPKLEKNDFGIIRRKNSKNLIISWGYLGVHLLDIAKEKDVDIFIFDKMNLELPLKFLDFFNQYESITLSEESYLNTGLAAILNPFLSNLKTKIIFNHIDSSISDIRAHRTTVWKKFNLDKID